jgi:hypothetical protein
MSVTRGKMGCGFLLLLFVALAFVWLRLHFAWYFVVPGARVTVDSKRVNATVHRHRDRAENYLIVTRENGRRRESYLLAPRFAGDCGTWVAPKSPIFGLGDVNPPCVFVGDVWGKQDAPVRRDLRYGSKSFEFTANDGKRVSISW